MKLRYRFGVLAGILLIFGPVSGCVTGRATAPEFTEEQPVREEAEVSGVISTVTEEGPVRRTVKCPPRAEVARPGAPSVEIGITTPVSPGRSAATAEGPTIYSLYECH